jgi:hypothetical protein
MFVLQNILLFSLLALLFPQTQTNPKQELNDQLYEAVRKGDVAAVTVRLRCSKPLSAVTQPSRRCCSIVARTFR